MPILGSYLLFHLAFNETFCWPGFASRMDLSYGVYLYAFPIQQLWVLALGIRSPWTLFVVAMPSALLAGFLSWHCVEKHFLRLKSRPSQAARRAPTGTVCTDGLLPATGPTAVAGEQP
jgi:peptidoglycan/LPS O-acetylase OafA/YrhL